MIDITEHNFQAEVIDASFAIPVLIDFWAPWCGPCKAIGPLLEQLEQDYAGAFKLVKINSDVEQQLSAAFGVRSIPTCILMLGGKPVDGFAGALPEGQLREFLDKHLPSPAEIAAAAEAEQAQDLLAEGDAHAALDKLAQALATYPGNDDTRYDYVRLLIAANLFDQAQAALAPKLAEIPAALRFTALAHWLEALRFAAADARSAWSMAQFDAKIAQNKRDFETRYAKSRVLMAQGDWTAAMDELLEIILRDKKWSDEAARKTMVSILELLTPPMSKAGADAPGKTASSIEIAGKATPKEDPQAELVSRYRRKLSMMLN